MQRNEPMLNSARVLEARQAVLSCDDNFHMSPRLVHYAIVCLPRSRTSAAAVVHVELDPSPELRSAGLAATLIQRALSMLSIA